MEKEIKINSENIAIPESSNEVASLRDEVKHLEEAIKELGALPEERSNTKSYALLAVVGIALLSLLLAGYVLFLRAPKKEVIAPVVETPITTTTATVTPATTTPVTIEVYKDSKPWYDVSIEYPNVPVAKDFIMDRYNRFAEDTGLLKPKNQKEAQDMLGLFSSDVKYTFNTTLSTASSTNTISYIFETYTFTGGAHGGTQVTALTLDPSGNIIPIERIIPDKDLEKVAAIAKQKITEEKRSRLSSTGMTPEDIKALTNYDEMVNDGTKPTRENYSVAWYDGDDIVIHFAQYQVGAYAEGMYDVRIKRSLLE